MTKLDGHGWGIVVNGGNNPGRVFVCTKNLVGSLELGLKFTIGPLSERNELESGKEAQNATRD